MPWIHFGLCDGVIWPNQSQQGKFYYFEPQEFFLDEFNDVFLDDINELPLEREIDHEIDLVANATMVSIAPYYLSLI